MNRNVIKVIMGLFTIMIFSMAGCNGNSGTTAPATGTTGTTGTTGSTAVADGFTWTENGSATVQTATTATFSTQYKTLMVLNGTTLLFEINLDGAAPATYTIGATNAITYTKVTPYFIATTGNVIITANANSKMSGTFQGTGTAAGGITSVAGTFTNVTVVP